VRIDALEQARHLLRFQGLDGTGIGLPRPAHTLDGELVGALDLSESQKADVAADRGDLAIDRPGAVVALFAQMLDEVQEHLSGDLSDPLFVEIPRKEFEIPGGGLRSRELMIEDTNPQVQIVGDVLFKLPDTNRSFHRRTPLEYLDGFARCSLSSRFAAAMVTWT